MIKTNKRRMHKLSLSSETLRKLTAPELARAQGGLPVTYSYCDGSDGDGHTDACETMLLCWERQ